MLSGMFDRQGGGPSICHRNLIILQTIFGANNVSKTYIEKRESHYKNMKQLFGRLRYCYTNGVDEEIVKELIRQSEYYDIIWLDNSCYGTLAKVLKENGYKGAIVSFFHNIETIYQKRVWWQNLLYVIYNRPIHISEVYAAHYSDVVFVLTERDRKSVIKMDTDSNVKILPSTLPDTFVMPTVITKATKERPLHLLFVGTSFYANINGLNWFIENVLPNADVKLTIVGHGMDIIPFPKSDKIEVYGFVDNLSSFYHKCDAVIAPIFEGSGMKTKTTEALMWGKYIIGTPEAFCGFDIDERQGISCTNKEDFMNAIEKIRVLQIPSYVEASRRLFFEKYSLQSSIEIVRNCFTAL